MKASSFQVLMGANLAMAASRSRAGRNGVALPGLEQGKQGAVDGDSGATAASVPSENEGEGGGEPPITGVAALARGTKVPSPGSATVVRSLIALALEAGVDADHPKLAAARAWLKGGAR
jgi:hypothetical protein